MIKSDSLLNLSKALLTAKKGFGPILRESENPGFKRNGVPSKYADLSTIIEATDASLLENGLLVIQFPYNEESRVGVNTLVLHESGEFIGDAFSLSLGKQDAQAGVGAVTYARRAALKGVLGLKEEDDDGNTASDRGRDRTEYHTSEPAPAKNVGETVRYNRPKSSGEPLSEEKSDVIREGSSDDLPTPDEKKAFYAQVSALQTELGGAGLKASRGLPINRKVLTFLLHITGAPEADAITRDKWSAFFKTIDIIKSNEGGVKNLIDAVNEKSNVKEAGGAQ